MSILKPTHLSHFKVIRRKIKRFHTTHESTINNMFLRQFEANNNKFRWCLKQMKLAKWRHRQSHYGIWLCSIQFSEFGPIEFVIPIDIKSMDNISNVYENDKQTNRIQKLDEQTTFDGSENSYARLQNNAYYHSQVAVGDPIRSKRMKRIRRTISYHTKNSLKIIPLLNKPQAVNRWIRYFYLRF